MLTSCSATADPEPCQAVNYIAGYQLNSPNRLIKLDNTLREISGLQNAGAGYLAAVQDEEATIFIVDIKSGEIVDQRHFGKPADCEGIAGSTDTFYILESSGIIFKVTSELNLSKTLAYPAILPHDREWEGLAYSEDGSLFAIDKHGLPNKNEIWKLDFSNGQPTATPYITVNHNSILACISRNPIDKISYSIAKVLGMPFGLVLQPSGLAIHPTNKKIYILSSASRLLVVLSAKGKLDSFIELPKALFPKPEAITFAPDGTFYIGNEGLGLTSPATILEFLYDER